MKFKKFLSYILSLSLLLSSGSFNNKAKAIDLLTTAIGILTISNSAVSTVKYIVDFGGKKVQVGRDRKALEKYNRETDLYKGLRPMPDVAKMIQDIILGVSPIRVYGQDRAKDQCLSALSGCIVNIFDEIDGRKLPNERHGNVVYMIGGSGVGKTTMGKAIASALLRYEQPLFFIDSSQVNRDQSLGEQLFRVIGSVANLRDAKLLSGDARGENLGTFETKVASPLLEHLFRWGDSGAVVIIDEFEKMKATCRSVYSDDDFEDKSADEIIKSIAANGYYMVGTEKVDCTKVLFIITTNETREQLEENFGQGGLKGGGAQRLNIIEFDSLDMSCCRRIVEDTVESIRKSLTSKNGDFKIKSIQFSEETLQNMSEYIFSQEAKQGRAKFDLEQQIISLFFGDLARGISNSGKSFIIQYMPSEQDGELGVFTKIEIKSSESNQRQDALSMNYDSNSRDPLVLVDITGDPLVLSEYM